MAKKNEVRDFISQILRDQLGEDWIEYYNESALLQYLNLKTGAIDGNSKTRRSLGNIYAIKGILHFYLEDGYLNNRAQYSKFTGYEFTKLLSYMRGEYGGEKIQNHSLNSRANLEFENKITHSDKLLIVQNSGHYLLNPDYLYVRGKDLSRTVVSVIDTYVELLKIKDNQLLATLSQLDAEENIEEQRAVLHSLLTEDSEARIFEIISYAILKSHYSDVYVYIGFTKEDLQKRALELYKTGRTNANDGGIDFVMRPLGRFFQVTEVDNYAKYFLDIDKIMKFPLTFVVKTRQSKEQVMEGLREFATDRSGGLEILEKKYMDSIEEVITINELSQWLGELDEKQISSVIEDMATYYKLELNM